MHQWDQFSVMSSQCRALEGNSVLGQGPQVLSFSLLFSHARIDRTCQAVHSTEAFLLENHSNDHEYVVNYGGVLWMKLDFSLCHHFAAGSLL